VVSPVGISWIEGICLVKLSGNILKGILEPRFVLTLPHRRAVIGRGAWFDS